MTGGEVAQIITSLATLTAALGALVVSHKGNQKVDVVAQKVEEVHAATNGLTAKLVDASKAVGNLEGRIELKHEQTK